MCGSAFLKGWLHAWLAGPNGNRGGQFSVHRGHTYYKCGHLQHSLHELQWCSDIRPWYCCHQINQWSGQGTTCYSIFELI
jgi:hypothetical protein